MNFKLKLSLTAMALLAMVSQVRAQGCAGAGVPFGNFAIGTLGNLVGVAGTDYSVKSWVDGFAATQNNGACPQASQIADFGGGNFYIYIDWSAACMVGCDSAGGPRNIAAINYRTGEGTAAHAGNFAVVSAAFNGVDGGWNIERIVNGNGGTAGCPGGIACQVRPLAIPVLSISTDPACGSTYNHALGTGNVCVSFTQPAVNGFFDAAAPATPPITGYEVYQISGAAAPTTSNFGSWGAQLTQSTPITCAAGTCSGQVTVSAVPSAQGAYFALRLVFAGGFARTDYVSANSARLGGPTGTSGLPSRVEVFNTTTNGRLPGVEVRWTTTNESTVAGFNILASTTQGGAYRQINTAQISAVNRPNTYLQTISNRSFITALGPANTVYLKLVTVLRDGTTREVGPVSFALTGGDREPPAGKGNGRQR